MTRFLVAIMMGGTLAIASLAQAGLHAGDVAPNFRGTDLGGVSRTLYEYRGKVVVLHVLGYS